MVAYNAPQGLLVLCFALDNTCALLPLLSAIYSPCHMQAEWPRGFCSQPPSHKGLVYSAGCAHCAC